MPKRTLDFRKLFAPSDSVAFIVIIMGLFIALFLDEMAVRLIGVCISILGGVALFMMISPRIAGLSLQDRKVSQRTEFVTKTQTDSGSKRTIFENYASSFGPDDAVPAVIDSNQTRLFDDIIQAPPQSLDDEPTQIIGPVSRAADLKQRHDTSLSEDVSAVRVISKKKSRTPATMDLVVDKKIRRATVQGPFVAENIPEEGLALSDEVIIRPRRTQPVQAPVSPPPPDIQPTSDVEHVADLVTHKRRHLNVSLSDFTDAEQDANMSGEPRKEFDYLLNRVLQVIRSMTNARSAAFFWVNAEKKQLILESKITDANHAFSDERKLPMGDDVVSKIAIHGRPEILTEIRASAELDLLPYYGRPAGTLSFIGVPVFFGGSVVGVLCADSTDSDAYDGITVGFLGHFTKLISGLVKSYTDKFDLINSSRMLRALTQFNANASKQNPTVSDVAIAAMDAAIKVMDATIVGTCLFQDLQSTWKVAEISSVEPEWLKVKDTYIDIENTVVGRCIMESKTVVSDGFSGAVLVSEGEPSIGLGQFIAVPLRSSTHNYGSLFIINPESSLSQFDVSILEVLGELAGGLIERLRSAEVITTGVLLDADTNVLNNAGFVLRVREEISRSVDYSLPFTLCMIQVDDISNDTSRASDLTIINHVLNLLRDGIRDYDILARVDRGTIALGLVGSTAQKTQLWMERTRREIASSVISINGRRSTVTVSIGIAEVEPSESYDVLIANARAVLARSMKQTNKVTVFA